MARLDPVHPRAETDDHRDQVADQGEQFPAVLTTRQAQGFIPCKSLHATYEWLSAHGIPRRGNGSVYRHDLERELARMKRRPRRTMHANSLANLRKRGA